MADTPIDGDSTPVDLPSAWTALVDSARALHKVGALDAATLETIEFKARAAHRRVTRTGRQGRLHDLDDRDELSPPREDDALPKAGLAGDDAMATGPTLRLVDGEDKPDLPARPRTFGLLRELGRVGPDFQDALPDEELLAWECGIGDVVPDDQAQAAAPISAWVAATLAPVVVHWVQQARDSRTDFSPSEWLETWLTTPARALGGEPPQALLGTNAGRDLVRRFLLSLESGAYW